MNTSPNATRRARRLLASTGAALTLFTAASSADVDTTASSAHLSADEAVIGGTVDLTLRSPLVGAPGVLAFGSTSTPIPLGPVFPVLLVGIPFLTTSGVIGADGRMVVSLPIAPAYPPGTEVFVQGAVISLAPFKVFGSAAARLAPGGPTAGFAGTGLPAVTGVYGSVDVDWVDVDKDGKSDVLLANEGTGALPALLMNQGGSFVDEAALRLPAGAQIPLATVEAADVDLDGDADLFLGGGQDVGSPAANQMAINDGSGSFSLDGSFPGGAGVPLDGEFGDVDGDGDPDLMVANFQDPDHFAELPDGVELYLNSAGAFAADPTFSNLPATFVHTAGGSISLGDADNDGDLDLFIARADSGAGGVQNQLLENDGTGSFTDITALSIPPMVDNSFEAEFVDVNGDGLLDIVVANSIASVPGTNLLINLGVSGATGVVAFNDLSIFLPADLGPATDIRQGVDVADVEGDGDPDILIAIHQLFDDFGQLDGDAVLLLNLGGIQGQTLGTFAVDAGFDVGGGGFICSDAAFGDADQDGDPDVYLTSIGDLFSVQPPQDVLLLNSL